LLITRCYVEKKEEFVGGSAKGKKDMDMMEFWVKLAASSSGWNEKRTSPKRRRAWWA
jgi:hypothetical protein